MANKDFQYHVLKLLEKNPDLTQRQLAQKLGVSLGKAHYLVKSLTDVGWVKFANFQRSDDKWRYSYLLTSRGVAEKASITVKFLARKQQEYIQLQKEIAQLKTEVQKQKILTQKSESFNGEV